MNMREKYEIALEALGGKFYHPFYLVNESSEQAIVGVDFIHKNQLDYRSIKREFHWSLAGTST